MSIPGPLFSHVKPWKNNKIIRLFMFLDFLNYYIENTNLSLELVNLSLCLDAGDKLFDFFYLILEMSFQRHISIIKKPEVNKLLARVYTNCFPHFLESGSQLGGYLRATGDPCSVWVAPTSLSLLT